MQYKWYRVALGLKVFPNNYQAGINTRRTSKNKNRVLSKIFFTKKRGEGEKTDMCFKIIPMRLCDK